MNPIALKQYSQQAAAAKGQGKTVNNPLVSDEATGEMTGFESLLFMMGGVEGMPPELMKGGMFKGQELVNELAPLLKAIAKAEGSGEELTNGQLAEALTQNLNLNPLEKHELQSGLAELGIKFDGKNLVQQDGKTIEPDEFLKSVKAQVETVLNDQPQDGEIDLPMMKGDFAQMMNKKGPQDAQRPLLAGQDYINNMKMMNNRQAVVVTENGPQIANIGQKAYAKEASLFENKLLNPKKSVEAAGEGKKGPEMNNILDVIVNQNGEGQQTQMNLNIDHNINPQDLANAEKAGKVLDLSHINAKNSSELITKITNYIEQSNVANSKEVDVFVKHDELGVFRIQAKRGDVGNTVDLTIATNSQKGNDFFVRNESDLLKGLNNSGIKVSDFKIVSSSENHSMSFDSQKGQSGSSGEWSQQSRSHQFSQGQNGQQQDSERRRELWQRYQESMYQAA